MKTMLWFFLTLAVMAISACTLYSSNFMKVFLPPTENGYLIYPSKLENCQLFRWYGGYRIEQRADGYGVTEALVPTGTESVEVPVFMGFISSVKVGRFNFVSEEEALLEVRPIASAPVTINFWVNGATVKVKTRFSCRAGERYFIIIVPTRQDQAVQLAPQLQSLQEWVEIRIVPAGKKLTTLAAVKAAK